MNYYLFRQFFLIVLLSLLVVNVNLNAQDPISGIYNLGTIDKLYQEITFEMDGHFRCTSDRINPGKTFYGLWTRINDSSIKLQADTALVLRFSLYNDQMLREFYCIQSKKDSMLIVCNFSNLDTLKKGTLKYPLWFYRVCSFRSFGEFKQHTNYFSDNIKVITTFYPNGNVKEITAYRKGLEHGNRLLYEVNGNLYNINYYKKGKLIRRFYCTKCPKFRKPWN